MGILKVLNGEQAKNNGKILYQREGSADCVTLKSCGCPDGL